MMNNANRWMEKLAQLSLFAEGRSLRIKLEDFADVLLAANLQGFKLRVLREDLGLGSLHVQLVA